MTSVDSTEAFVSCRVAIPVAAPDRILVVPWGRVESKSRDFIVDELAARRIVDSFVAHGSEIPIDFEHTTVGGKFASPDGSAPAMGWIKSLDVKPSEGIFAAVEWTERGAAFVRSKEYRYVSPTLIMKPGSDAPEALHSVALTNKPAIVDMAPLVNNYRAIAEAALAEGSRRRLRPRLIAAAATEFRKYPAVQHLCTCSEYVNSCLREFMFSPLSDREGARLQNDKGSLSRAAVVAHAEREWAGLPLAQKLCTQKQYASAALRAAGLVPTKEAP